MLDSIKSYAHRNPRTYGATLAGGAVSIGLAAVRFKDHLGFWPAIGVMSLAVVSGISSMLILWFGAAFWEKDRKWASALDWRDVRWKPFVVMVLFCTLAFAVSVCLLYPREVRSLLSR